MIFKKQNHKHLKAAILLLVFVLGIYGWSFTLDFTPDEKPIYGMTFSKPHAEHLGLDWKATFIAQLDELGIRHWRLSAYWNEIEPEDDVFNFDDLDWQINEVRKRGGTVTLAIGRRLPRWPECHVPEWVISLTEEQAQSKILEMLPEVINRYKHDPTIVRWQIENEPLLPFFGECPSPDQDFLEREIALVQELDDRPTMTTASGEFGNWTQSGKNTDLLGVSLYRVIWKPIIQEIVYPISPGMYKLRQWVVQQHGVGPIILSELQTEPWVPNGFTGTPLVDQYKTMNPNIFDQNIAYANASGFTEIWLWGGEWWYWLKTQHGKTELWEKGKALYQK